MTVGSSTVPYSKKAKITIFGDYNSQTITMSGAMEQGNKIIANLGTVKMFGTARSRNARLTAEA